MKIPLSWLKEYLPTELSPEQIAENLTLIGLEVDSIEPTPLDFEGVVVGKVIAKEPHPDADKLCVATVSDGSEELQVVCGAANCREGLKTALAKVGGRVGEMRIKRSKLRGVESFGMLCSADELGLSAAREEGILELPETAVEGTDFAEIYGDLILEIALTPNLAHCASVRGVARELAAITQEKLHLPRLSFAEKSDAPIEKATSVRVENPESCPRYACRVLTGVQVAPSPDWLQVRLTACGIRPINNIVDITNLVLMELGQPLHAFDLDTLDGKQIVVRNAKKEEKIVTLDGNEHFPAADMLLICDANKPIAVAGVMGGQKSEVSEKTTTVLLESAYFEKAQVRKTAKRLDIHTEASYRFERGCDPNTVIEALDRATAWICEIAGGTTLNGAFDVKNGDFEPTVVSCRVARVNRVLGTNLASSEMETLFRRIGLEIREASDETITVAVPTYRHDIAAEIDLIEEIARLYGFDNIHTGERARFRTGTLPHAPLYLLEREIRGALRREGLQELLTCDLISPEEAALTPANHAIHLLNPRSTKQSVLRSSLLPGLLHVVKHNHDHGVHTIAGFELGRLHFKTKQERYLEPTVVSIVLAGEKSLPHWEQKESDVDFFDLKGYVENLLVNLNIKGATFAPSSHANFHPGQQAAVRVGELEIGIIGQVHPATLKKVALDHPVYFAELNVEDLQKARTVGVKMEPLPQYPASTRDWTVTVEKSVPVGDLLEKIRKRGSKRLESVNVLDVYHSDALGSDRKNITFRFVYRDRERTLSVEAVEKEHKRITQNEDLL